MSILGLPHEHFASKWKLVQQEVSEASALVALVWRQRSSRGAVVAYYSRDGTERYGELTGSIAFCGAGNYGDFTDLLHDAQELVDDFIKVYGEAALSINVFRKDFARYIRDVYRSEPKAFGVELLIIEDRPDLEMPRMLRIRPNGKDHPCERFAIIGGYRPPDVPESQRSPRKTLREFFLTHCPEEGYLTKSEAERMAIHALQKFAAKNADWKLQTKYFEATPTVEED